jgi:hypothetical protein
VLGVGVLLGVVVLFEGLWGFSVFSVGERASGGGGWDLFFPSLIFATDDFSLSLLVLGSQVEGVIS